MNEKMVESKVKCPKCKSNNLILEEVWKGHFIQWEQVDGKFDRNDGVLQDGDACKVVGSCKECNHKWTIRKALQIDDIIKQ